MIGTNKTVPVITATYAITANPAGVEARARDICYEQTVELPPNLVGERDIVDRIIGRIREIRPDPVIQNRFRVVIEFAPELANGQIPQLLNLLYGNISLQPDIRLIDFELPAAVLDRFNGPNLGIDGIRKATGVRDRPLLMTALKPRGSQTDDLAAMAYAFAAGGGDLIKDDHNLVENSVEDLIERARRIQAAVERANRDTGNACCYLPHLSLPVDDLEKALHSFIDSGVKAVLVSPFLLGLDTIRSLAQRYSIGICAHPALTGGFFHRPTHGIAPEVVLGKLFRLAGADIVIFPNVGGRFALTSPECYQIARALRAEWGRLRPALPAPAGGMRLQNLTEMVSFYGKDAVFLIGAGLLRYKRDLREGTATFMAELKRVLQTKGSVKSLPRVFACETALSATRTASGPQSVLRFADGFRWQDRPAGAYKKMAAGDFSRVTRHELIGKFGEQTSFDLRYFEIGPGGYSSLEKHAHTHVIICIRGEGELHLEGESLKLKKNDIAYIAPNQVHQLRNSGTTPFGFFCLVDHERDRPRKP